MKLIILQIIKSKWIYKSKKIKKKKINYNKSKMNMNTNIICTHNNKMKTNILINELNILEIIIYCIILIIL